MKNWGTLSILLLCASTHATPSQNNHVQARETLKKWGIAYCLDKYLLSKVGSQKAAIAMGGYFQQGRHDSQKAYEIVASYIDNAFDKYKFVEQESKHKNEAMFCIDTTQDKQFDSAIKTLDKYVNP